MAGDDIDASAAAGQSPEPGAGDAADSKAEAKPRPKRSLFPKHWPWSKCPAGTDMAFRRCCGRSGDDACHYVPEEDDSA